MQIETHHYHEPHRSQHSGWLRASVLGANDGLISTSSLVLGMATAQAAPATILLTGIAGLAAGALSMAAGEYVSVKSQADAEEADHCIELVGQRDRARDIAFGQHVAGETRPVVMVHCFGDIGFGAFMLGVVTAHDALQLGKLADHVGEQVDLADEAGVARLSDIGTQLAGHEGSDGAETLGTVAERAELVVIDDRAELHRT